MVSHVLSSHGKAGSCAWRMQTELMGRFQIYMFIEEVVSAFYGCLMSYYILQSSACRAIEVARNLYIN